MLVRLAAEWTDPFGVDHHAGDVVDIDVITLAELEQRGVVQAMSNEPEEWSGPGEETEEAAQEWSGPGAAEETEVEEWSGPGAAEETSTDE